MSDDMRLLVDLLGFAMLCHAFLAFFAAWTWLTVLAFKTHPATGAAAYFLPWYAVQYAVEHWPDTRSPGLLALAALLSMASVSAAGDLIEWKYGPAPYKTSASSSTHHRH